MSVASMDVITLGGGKLAVVHSVSPGEEAVTAVYLAHDRKIIAERFVLRDGKWQREHENQSGGYADHSRVYGAAVSKLKSVLPPGTKYFY